MIKKILVVDDEKDFLELLSYRLAASDYMISIADNGSKAFIKAKEEKPDLILMDVKMPVEDGVSACRRLKEDSRTRNIPVIIISAFPNPEVKTKLLDMGVKDYITKPYNDNELLEKIRNLTR